MSEKRKYQRVSASSDTLLSCRDMTHKGKLENISRSGALVRFEHGTNLPLGSGYDLSIYFDEEAAIKVKVEVVCFTFAMAGIKFVSYESDSESRLSQQLEKLSEVSDSARIEQERIRRRLADYLREE